jgi:hypothetical protein
MATSITKFVNPLDDSMEQQEIGTRIAERAAAEEKSTGKKAKTKGKQHGKMHASVDVGDYSSSVHMSSADCATYYGHWKEKADGDPLWRNPPNAKNVENDLPTAPTVVKVRWSLIRMDIDTSTSNADIRIGCWMSWQDPRLTGRPRTRVLPQNLWLPAAVVIEKASGFTREITQFSVTPDSLDTVLTALIWYDGTINNPMDLQDFPFDIENTSITFAFSECWRRQDNVSNVNFKSDYRVILDGDDPFTMAEDITNGMSLYDWKVLCSSVEYVHRDRQQDTIGLKIFISRNTNYYVWKIIVPLFLITILNFLGLFIPGQELADRLAHSTTLFLAAMALIYVVADDLPKTPYQTAVDRNITVTLVLLMTTAVFAVVAHEEELQEQAAGLLADQTRVGETFCSEGGVLCWFSDENRGTVAIGFSTVYIIYMIREYTGLIWAKWRKTKAILSHGQAPPVDEKSTACACHMNGTLSVQQNIVEDPTFEVPSWLLTEPSSPRTGLGGGHKTRCQ